MTTQSRDSASPSYLPDFPSSSRIVFPMPAAQDQKTFFTIFQSIHVCSCPQRHLTPGKKLCLRIAPSKTWTENATRVRRLFFVEKHDILTFARPDGTPLRPGYDELKEGGRKVLIMAVIERTKTVELIDRLSRDNAKRRFLIYEDAPLRGWLHAEEDYGGIKRRDGDVCVFPSEQQQFEDTLYDGRMQRNADPQQEAVHVRESESGDDDDDDVEGQLSRHEPRQANAGMRRDISVTSWQEHTNIESATSLTDEEDHHISRTVRGVGSSSVPITWDVEQQDILKRGRQLAIPTDEAFRLAATSLRWMR